MRPHDIEVLHGRDRGAPSRPSVVRLVRIGFEVRAELRSGDLSAGEPWVQLTRGQADALELRAAAHVWLRPAQHATDPGGEQAADGRGGR